MEVGDDGPAGEGSFGGIEGYGVAGAWLKVGQLVLLLVAFYEECISCHWKKKSKKKSKTHILSLSSSV